LKQIFLWIALTSLSFANINISISYNNKLVSVTKKELADLYLGKIDNIRGVLVTPIDNKESYKEFYLKITEKSPKQLRAYWMREMYKGDRTPPKKYSTSVINKMMKSNRKIISYSSSELEGKLIMKIK
jgi:hypothetical protein